MFQEEVVNAIGHIGPDPVKYDGKDTREASEGGN